MRRRRRVPAREIEAGFHITLSPVTADTVGSDTDFSLAPVTADSVDAVDTVNTADTADSVGSDTECSLTPKAKLSLFDKIFPT